MRGAVTQAQINMAILYERLSEIGFSKKFVRENALPDWWDEEFEATPGAAVQAIAYVSRRLNLDIASLVEPEAVPAFKHSCNAKFKTRLFTNAAQLQVAQCMAARVAEMAAYAYVPECKSLPESALNVRNEILKTHNFVDLEGLLEFCCNYGIPVIHFNKFPPSTGVRKFDGMVGCFYNRPVIVISLKDRSPARLLFILAHELGHIIKGHIQGASIVDEEIRLESIDNEEIEANEFAVEILLGKPDMGYYTPRVFNGSRLATYAQQNSIRDNAAPGVVVLNYAWSKATRAVKKKELQIIWATAFKALKIIEGDADAPTHINRYVRTYLDLDKLDEDSQDYLELALTG